MLGSIGFVLAVAITPAAFGVVAGSVLGRQKVIRRHRVRVYQWLLAASSLAVVWHAVLIYRVLDGWIETDPSFPVSTPAQYIAATAAVILVGAVLSFFAGREFSAYASVAPLVTAMIYVAASQLFLNSLDKPVGRILWFLVFLPAVAAALSLAAFWEAASHRSRSASRT